MPAYMDQKHDKAKKVTSTSATTSDPKPKPPPNLQPYVEIDILPSDNYLEKMKSKKEGPKVGKTELTIEVLKYL